MELYLVGSVNCDFKGPSRLKTVLHGIQPEKIVLAMDETSVYQATEIERIVAKSSPSDLLKLIQAKNIDSDPDTVLDWLNTVGYEYLISEAHCQNYGSELHLTHPPSEKTLDEESLGGMEPFLSSTPEELATDVDTIYRTNGETLKIEDESFARIEVDHIANYIRSLEGKVMFVGTLNHVYWKKHNLYDSLVDLNPRRLNLGKIPFAAQKIENPKIIH